VPLTPTTWRADARKYLPPRLPPLHDQAARTDQSAAACARARSRRERGLADERRPKTPARKTPAKTGLASGVPGPCAAANPAATSALTGAPQRSASKLGTTVGHASAVDESTTCARATVATASTSGTTEAARGDARATVATATRAALDRVPILRAPRMALLVGGKNPGWGKSLGSPQTRH